MGRRMIAYLVLYLVASIIISQFTPTPSVQVAVMVTIFFIAFFLTVLFCELHDLRQCLKESKTPVDESNFRTLVANLIIMAADGDVRMSDALEQSQLASHLEDLAQELHAELERIWPNIRIRHERNPGVIEPFSGLMDYLTALRESGMDPQCLLNVYIKTCIALGRHRGEAPLWELHEYGPMQLTSFARLLGRYLERFHPNWKSEADRLLSAFPFTPV